MANVDVTQQYVLTTCVGRPLTMHCIGWPTYWVAVMIIEQMSSSTVVKILCSLNTTLSILISWYLKYALSPPSNLNILCLYQLFVLEHFPCQNHWVLILEIFGFRECAFLVLYSREKSVLSQLRLVLHSRGNVRVLLKRLLSRLHWISGI